MKYIIDLFLDGYDTEKEQEEACRQFILDELDISSSSIKVIGKIEDDEEEKSFVLYGGSKETIINQLICKHDDWYGPCIDSIGRYYKCLKCFCLKYDLTQKEYYKIIRKDSYIKKRAEDLEYVLTEIINDLPVKRDWLDPSLEKMARDIIGV